MDVYVVGERGTVLRYQGGDWQVIDAGTDDRLWAVWCGADGDVHASGPDCLLHYDGETWSDVNNPSGYMLRDIWGIDGSNVYAVGHGATVLRFNGQQWIKESGWTAENLADVWAIPAVSALAVGSGGTAVFFDGTQWTLTATGVDVALNGVWGDAAAGYYVVGDSGTVLRFNQGSWSQIDVNVDEDLRGVWGDTNGHVYVAGTGGRILRCEGSGCTSMNTGITHALNSIWSEPSGQVLYAVGEQGTILRYNGTWEPMESNTPFNIPDVWGRTSTDVYAIVYGAYDLLHCDGSSWEKVWGLQLTFASSITGTPSGNAMVVCGGGSVYRKDAGGWHTDDTQIGPATGLLGICAYSDERLLAVGWSGCIVSGQRR